MTNIIDHIDRLIEQYEEEKHILQEQLKTEENQFIRCTTEGQIMTYTFAIVDLTGLKLLCMENKLEELKKEAQENE